MNARDGKTNPSRQGRKQEERDEEADELLLLASKYRMNTDTRRSIFCIIMGSDDCDDAFEKLVRSGFLKNRFERDSIRVLMECCGNEKTYNPFYAHLAGRVMDYQQQCRFSLQLAYWDFFKQIGDCTQRKVANLAKLLFTVTVEQRNIKLTTLKVIDTTPDTIKDNAAIFLTIFFSSMFDYCDDANDVKSLLDWGIPKRLPSGMYGGRGNSRNKDGSDDNSDADSEDGRPASNDEKGFGDESGLHESLSVFFLHTLKASPKNKKKSKFRAHLKAAVKACEVDEFDSMVPM